MEGVYSPFQYRSTDPMDIQKYFQDYSARIGYIAKIENQPGEDSISDTEKYSFEKIYVNVKEEPENDSNLDMEAFKLMGVDIPLEDKIRLINTCSIDHLKTPKEEQILEVSEYLVKKKLWKPSEVPEEAKVHASVKCAIDRREDSHLLKRFLTCLKYRPEVTLDYTASGGAKDLKEDENFIVSVRVYFPFRYEKGKRIPHLPRFSHEILLLGSHTVADLRDKILCAADFGLHSDVSDNFKNVEVTKNKYKSGFIYIDGTFYNDLRHEGNIDYSEVILNWSVKSQCGPFKTAEIDKVYIKDLKVRFGYPQLYQHQGNCEHILIFSDARLLHSSDSHYSEDYPVISSVSMAKSQYCFICGIVVAKWIVVSSDRMPTSPAYLCNDCFISFNYIDGKKIGNFKAYPFSDKSAIM